jgi:amidohydrolase
MLTTSVPPLSQLFADPTRIRLEIQTLYPELVTWRRQIHQHPELGFREQKTAQFITQKLTQWGIEHRSGVAQTGVVATIAGTGPGPVLGLRADMDALPIQEENEVSYRSQTPGVMHACGHDGHTTIALGVAHYLQTHRDRFAGTVKLIFQPAEEGPGGAQPMIAEGVLQNPQVEAMLGLHLWNYLPLGQVGVRSGPLMAAVECFDCKILGRGGHGAIPQTTVDSILVASQVVTALQTIVARNIDPIESAVVTVGQMQAGTARNVIADQATLSGTVRYFNPQFQGFIQQRIEQIIAGVCQSQGARYEFDYQHFYPPVLNHPDMAELVRSVAESVVETPAGIVPDCQTMGGEDMAYFLQAVPGCYFFLGSANAAQDLAYPHHHPRFNFDETVLALGVELLVRCVERFCGAPS